jgi:hypothetical protein
VRRSACPTVEGLYLALLIDAQYDRTLRRRQIEANDIAHLLDEQRIG